MLVLLGSVGVIGAPPVNPAEDLQADVRRVHFKSDERLFKSVDPEGNDLGPTAWRVVNGAGNCCEHYLTSTETGRLVDLGGGFPYYTDDGGQSWWEVRGPGALGGGEGAIAGAPGGDIVGVEWTAWTADQLETYKYDSGERRWFFSRVLLHAPFYDRPFITAVKGPFNFGTETYPWISIIMSGSQSKDLMLYSFDGLNYFAPAQKLSEQLLTSSPVKRFLDPVPDEDMNSYQTLTWATAFPMAGGGALAPFGQGSDANWAIMEPPELTWKRFSLPAGQLENGEFVVDARGNLHTVAFNFSPTERMAATGFKYRFSVDGGRSWRTTYFDLPDDYGIERQFQAAPYFEIEVNTEAARAVVATHAYSPSRGKDQDFLFSFSLESGEPLLERIYYAGRGDGRFCIGLSCGPNRLDFMSVAILPDGRIATSFADASSPIPLLAIQSPPTDEQPTPEPTYSVVPAPDETPAASPTPSSSPAAEPPPEASGLVRSISLTLEGHLKARGRLRSIEGPSECVKRVPVSIQRLVGGRWRTIKRAHSSSFGTYRAKLPDRPGRYRARLLPYPLGTEVRCDAATSQARRHRH